MLAKNILILSLVHVVRLVLPLLLIPILTRRIAADEFGIYMYAISFSAWLSIFIEYGFSISSTREIAGTNSREEISATIHGTQSAKFLLIMATLPFLAFAIFFVPVFKEYSYWAITAWLLGVLTALSPIYYFQGREKLGVVGIVEASSGLMTFIAVFYLIHGSEDFYRLSLIILTAKVVGLVFLTRKMYLNAGISKFIFCNFHDGIKILKSGFNLFIFQGAVSFYTLFNVVFLGFFCSPVQVGYYAVAERLMRAGLGFIGQFSNAIFPRLNSMRLGQPEKMKKLRLHALFYFFLIGLLGMVLTWLLSPLVVKYMFGEKFNDVTNIIQTLALLVPAVAISSVLGFQYLLVDRHEKLFNMIIVGAALVNVSIAYMLIMKFEAQGMAISWIVVEWIIMIALSIAVFSLRRTKASIITD